MKTTLTKAGALILIISLNYSLAFALPERDLRGDEARTLDTPRTFPHITTLKDWKVRREEIRAQVLVSAGLYPQIDKAPLKATIFGRTEHGDFSVEKVYIQTYPGFYFCGNLFRPLGKGDGPFPAVLNPHGHWNRGRLEDTTNGSIIARCISFARMGMIAFAYDMVGYNDTLFKTAPGEAGYRYHRTFGTNYTDQLWGISLMGLQTYNSIRALDFIMSLTDVDKTRIACTGASGGGTQTFILGAIDDRLSVLAPTVMVSHSMQGGCSCENMPGLRVKYSNMEFAAVPAPKPQIFMAATGDWTKTFMTIEGPAIASIYKLFNATNKIYYEVLPFNHNYNKTTREAVYNFFEKWLLGRRDAPPYKEAPYPPATNLDLRVFPDGKLPSDAVTQDELRQYLIKQTIAKLNDLKPKDKLSLAKFKEIFFPAWKHILQIEFPSEKIETETVEHSNGSGFIRKTMYIGAKGRGDRIPIIIFEPERIRQKTMAILVHPRGKSAYLDSEKMPSGLAKFLVEDGIAVMLIDTFLTGELSNIKTAGKRNYFEKFFTTYNRTDCQERVGDLAVAAQYARSLGYKTVLCGQGRGGLWAILASPIADAVIADSDRFNSKNDNSLLVQDVFVPLVRKIGGFEGVLALSAPNPVMIFNTGDIFDVSYAEDVYSAVNSSGKFKVAKNRLQDVEIASWIKNLKF